VVDSNDRQEGGELTQRLPRPRWGSPGAVLTKLDGDMAVAVPPLSIRQVSGAPIQSSIAPAKKGGRPCTLSTRSAWPAGFRHGMCSPW